MGVTNQPTIKNIDLSKIKVREGFNTRPESDPNYIRTLAEDIHLHGLQTPIQVEPAEEKDTFYIVAGHGRFDAVQYANEHYNAGIKTMMAIVKRDLDDTKRDEIMLSDRLARTLEPIAYAKAMRRMMEREGISQTEFAARYGVTVAYAGDLKLLANAPKPVQAAVEEGVVSSTEAVRTIKEYGEEAAVEIVEELREEAANEAPEATEGDAAPSWANDDAPAEPAVRRAKKSKKDTERVAAKKGVAPKKGRKEATAPDFNLAEFAESAAYFMDALIGHMKADNHAGQRRAAENMGNILREYLRSGHEMRDTLSGITAETTDDELMWATEPGSVKDEAA
jgi:ParB/RepB/Spo0J family partition protein